MIDLQNWQVVDFVALGKADGFYYTTGLGPANLGKMLCPYTTRYFSFSFFSLYFVWVIHYETTF